MVHTCGSLCVVVHMWGGCVRLGCIWHVCGVHVCVDEYTSDCALMYV